MNINLTEQEVLLVGKGLGMLPFSEVAQFIMKLQQQVNEQAKLAKESKEEVNENQS